MHKFDVINRQKACRYGQMLYNINDTYVGRSLDLYGEYSEGEVELFRQIIKPGSLIVEIGANIGAHTVFLAQQVGATGLIVAFEPQRVVFQTLCANLALNSITNVLCLQQAVGSKFGTIRIPNIDYRQEANFGSVTAMGHEVGEPVPMVTLDGMNLLKCHLLKVDVEGMEKDVLEGAAKLIERHKPVLYLENDKKEKVDELIRYVDALGYLMYWHKPYYYNPENYFGNPSNVFPRTLSQNMLCIHKSVHQDLTGFEAVEVPPKEPAAQNH